MFKRISLPFQLLGVIAFVLLFGNYFSHSVVRALYTFSVLFKQLLSFLLPLVIFSFVLTGILSFKKKAPLILAILVAAIFLSNSLIALLAYAIGICLASFATGGMSMDGIVLSDGLTPYYQFAATGWISSEYALLVAIGLGILLSFISVPAVEAGIQTLKSSVEKFLNCVFIPLLPLYVCGFLLEMQHRGIFVTLFEHYARACIVILCAQIIVLLLYYFLAACGSISRMVLYIKNAMPSYLAALSTMSSTAALPVSVVSAEKNMGNKSLAQMAMPIMANIHLVGDSIGTPLLAMVSMVLFLGTFPDVTTYITFVFFFCSAMLAVSGIPGGGIIVMIPILVSQLGFNEQMVSIITALYLLLDPFGTAANVMGDGALIILVQKLLKKLRIIS